MWGCGASPFVMLAVCLVAPAQLMHPWLLHHAQLRCLGGSSRRSEVFLAWGTAIMAAYLPGVRASSGVCARDCAGPTPCAESSQLPACRVATMPAPARHTREPGALVVHAGLDIQSVCLLDCVCLHSVLCMVWCTDASLWSRGTRQQSCRPAMWSPPDVKDSPQLTGAVGTVAAIHTCAVVYRCPPASVVRDQCAGLCRGWGLPLVSMDGARPAVDLVQHLATSVVASCWCSRHVALAACKV